MNLPRLVEGDGAGAMFVVVDPPEQPRPCPVATTEERRDAWKNPRISFDADESYSERLDEYRRDLILVCCPHCHRNTAPFMRRELPKRLESEWEWVGLDYKQPYTDYLCACAKCEGLFVLHIYSPQ